MGMFDDLIPQQATPAPVAPPGMFDDLIPTAGAGSTELVSTTPAQGDQPARVTIGTNPQAPPSAMHGFRVGAQGVAKGLLHTAALPFDLMAGAQNLVTGGINKVFGTEIPQATPASQLAEQAAAPIMVPPSEMSPQERLVENISDFGTQGLGLGAMLAARAPALAANAVAPAKDIATRSLDAMARPYASAPSRTVTGDAIAGAGSGAGVTAQQDYAPDSKVAQVLAPLAGGVGAAGLQGLAEGVGGLIRNLFNRRADVNVPASPSGAPYTVADTNRAAQQFQEQTRGAPRAVAQDIRENAAELTNPTQPGEVPIAPSAIPTTGMLSRDIGLVQAEQQARLKGNQPFIERDQNVKGAAADQVASMRDPGADQGAVGRFMEEEPKRLAEARDEEALPLLRQAEQSGVQVDANRVAALIDEKLSTAKRPPVRAALTEARKHLNKVGTDELDTSVSGLYEARKAVNDIIEGRGENATGRFAKREMLDVRNALDESITAASPEFGQYLQKYREGSEPVNAFTESEAAQSVVNSKHGDIRNTVKSIMANGVYGGERQAEEIGKLIAQSPEAKDGFRAAVADVLTDRVTGTKQVGEQNYEVQYARLAKEFKDNENTLAKVYSPEEMNTLRQAHKMLGYFKEAEKRATVGSQTAERMLPQWFQLGLRHIYGDIKGGGVAKRLKLMLELLPSNKQSANEIMNQAWFDPNVAAYLLEKPIADKFTLQYNPRLQRVIAVANAARGGNDHGDKH